MSIAAVSAGGSRWIDERWFVRALEIFPGAITWLTLLLPILLSVVAPVWVAYFIIAFDLYWMVKSFRLSVNLIRGYRQLHYAQRVDWNMRLDWLHDPGKYIAQNQVELATLSKKEPGLLSSIWLRSTSSRRHY